MSTIDPTLLVEGTPIPASDHLLAADSSKVIFRAAGPSAAAFCESTPPVWRRSRTWPWRASFSIVFAKPLAGYNAASASTPRMKF